MTTTHPETSMVKRFDREFNRPNCMCESVCCTHSQQSYKSFTCKEIQLAVNKAEKRMIEKVKKARFEGYLKGREEGLNLFNKVKGIKITGV